MVNLTLSTGQNDRTAGDIIKISLKLDICKLSIDTYRYFLIGCRLGKGIFIMVNMTTFFISKVLCGAYCCTSCNWSDWVQFQFFRINTQIKRSNARYITSHKRSSPVNINIYYTPIPKALPVVI